ncbi:MAG: thiamine phosphate synthase [Proteobacteria bacterium]|nr:thiamine phosphate synthase [Pseudomonadota bacterium]
MLPRICIVTDRKLVGDGFLVTMQKLIENGFNFIQLREKDLNAKELYLLAKKIIDLRGDKVRLVINDRVDVAYVVGATGVHLGANSLPSCIVKEKFEGLIVGISVHSKEELEKNSGYDYVFFGNVFETDCKPGITGKGLDLLKNIVEMTDKPVYAIGGITPDNVLEVLRTGVYGVAVRSLAFKGLDEMLRLRKLIGEYYG